MDDPYPVSEEVTEKEFLGLTKGGWPSSQRFLQDFDRHNYNLETQRIKDKLKAGDDWSTYTKSEQERVKDYFYKQQGKYKETDKIPGEYNEETVDKGVPFEKFTGQPLNIPRSKLGQNIILPFMLKKELPDDKTAIGKVMKGIFDFPTPLNKQAWKERGLSTLLEKGKKAGIDPKVIEDVWDKEQKRVEDLSAEMYYEWSENEARKRRSGTNLATGGKVMPGGLSNLKKSININGQPHSLAWINPGEASALKAMGGSGKPGPGGIPSYQWEFTGPSEQEWAEAWDFGDDPAIAEPSHDPWQEERAEIIARSGTGGGRGITDPTQDPVIARTMETGESPTISYLRQTHQDVQDQLKGMGPSERKGQDERGLFVETLQERFPDLAKQFDLEGFAKDYNPFFPGALPIKLFGGLMGWLRGKTSPVVATIMVHGKKMNVHEDGSISEAISTDYDYGDGDNESPVKKKFPLKKIAAAEKEEEKELTGIAKLIASIKDKKHLLPQFKNIVAAGFSEQEAADMLDVPLADMLDASSDTFIT